MIREAVLILSLLVGISALAEGTSSPATWEVLSRSDGIAILQKELKGTSAVALRGEVILDSPVSKVATILFDTSQKTHWVSRAKEAHDVRVIGPYERIEYQRASAPWPLDDRDFVFNAKVAFDRPNQKMFVRLKSVEDPLAPPVPSLVRGELIECTYTLTAIENGAKTKVEVEIQIDPKGSPPSWAVNKFQKTWPRETLEGMRSQAARPDLAENKGVREELLNLVPTQTVASASN